VNDYADKSYTIKWSDDHPLSKVQISLYYDTVNSGFNGTLITQGISEMSMLQLIVISWDTSALPRAILIISMQK